jgi:hypothetical protein
MQPSRRVVTAIVPAISMRGLPITCPCAMAKTELGTSAGRKRIEPPVRGDNEYVENCQVSVWRL